MPLTAHNLTGLCAECKFIARNERMGYSAASEPPVSHTEAITNIVNMLGGRIILEQQS